MKGHAPYTHPVQKSSVIWAECARAHTSFTWCCCVVVLFYSAPLHSVLCYQFIQSKIRVCVSEGFFDYANDQPLHGVSSAALLNEFTAILKCIFMKRHAPQSRICHFKTNFHFYYSEPREYTLNLFWNHVRRYLCNWHISIISYLNKKRSELFEYTYLV